MLNPTYPILPKNGRGLHTKLHTFIPLTKLPTPPALIPYHYVMGPAVSVNNWDKEFLISTGK